MERSGEQDVTGLELAKPFQSSEPAASSSRPKLLFLAHPFPPLRTSGAVRTINIAKFLARMGWQVTVVTPDPALWRTVDDPDKTTLMIEREGIRRLTTAHRWNFLNPVHLKSQNEGFKWLLGGVGRRIARLFQIDRGAGWVAPAEVATAALTAADVDVIFATGGPFAAFSLAHRLSARLNVPYVLDYRDPWTGNPHASSKPWFYVRQAEAKLLAGCSAVTVVSDSWKVALDQQFEVGNKTYVIPNGYDPEDFSEIPSLEFGHFSIVYAGNFYPPKRVITPIIAALRSLKLKNSCDRSLFFHYYGRHGSHVRSEAERFDVQENVILHGSVPRREALSAVRGANVAVVITSVLAEADADDNGTVPAKLFESLGLGTLTLLITHEDSDAAVIAGKVGRTHVFTGDNIDGIALFLEDAMAGRFVQKGEPELFGWPSLVKNLDHVLRAAVGSNRRVCDVKRSLVVSGESL